MKNSIVIPIGKFSFFVHANVENIHETTNDEELDIVFVISHDVDPHVKTALDDVVDQYDDVRFLQAPFSAGSNHLMLLDWAVRQPSISEWMVTQHCDVFWREEGWLSDVNEAIENGIAAICLPNYQYKIGSTEIPIVGDTFGAYHRPTLERYNWSFGWNKWQEGTVSSRTHKMMSTGQLRRINGKRFVLGEFLDGSVILSLEMASQDPNMIRIIYSLGLEHLLAFFRICDSIHWNKDNRHVFVDLPFMQQFGGVHKQLWIDSIAKYSFLTSLVFNKSEVHNPLPWALMEKISQQEQISLAGGSSVSEWVAKYSKTEASDTIGMDDLGIETIQFQNKEYKF